MEGHLKPQCSNLAELKFSASVPLYPMICEHSTHNILAGNCTVVVLLVWRAEGASDFRGNIPVQYVSDRVVQEAEVQLFAVRMHGK